MTSTYPFDSTENLSQRVTGNSTVTVKELAGVLKSVMVGANWTGGRIILYDNTSASGTIIFSMYFGTASGGLLSTTGQPSGVLVGPLDIQFFTGLTAVTSGSTSNDVVIIYK